MCRFLAGLMLTLGVFATCPCGEGADSWDDIALELTSRHAGIIFSQEHRAVPVSVGVDFLGLEIGIEFDMGMWVGTGSVILNGPDGAESLHRGDEVPGLKGVTVKRIEQNAVIYLYEGEERRISFP